MARLNKPIAKVKYELIELEERFGIMFEEQLDDLYYFNVAILELKLGLTIALVRYRNCPSSGTEIWVSSEIDANEGFIHDCIASLNFGDLGSSSRWAQSRTKANSYLDSRIDQYENCFVSSKFSLATS